MGALDAGITQILYRISTGDRSAADGLMPLVYDNLRRLANSLLVYEPRETTLQPTELVHEAYLKLVDQTRVNWRGRSHFFAAGAQAMRRILVDRARDRSAKKRGGSLVRVQLRDADKLLVFYDDYYLSMYFMIIFPAISLILITLRFKPYQKTTQDSKRNLDS